MKEKSMKKKIDLNQDDELRPEYSGASLRDGVRGKYVARYRAGINLVLLDPDVAAIFPNDKSVNQALRLLIQIARSSVDHPTE